jgi:hypothetical protein
MGGLPETLVTTIGIILGAQGLLGSGDAGCYCITPRQGSGLYS